MQRQFSTASTQVLQPFIQIFRISSMIQVEATPFEANTAHANIETCPALAPHSHYVCTLLTIFDNLRYQSIENNPFILQSEIGYRSTIRLAKNDCVRVAIQLTLGEGSAR